MNHLVRALFHELADRSQAERETIFAERGISSELRAEVESLLRFDSSDSGFTDCVAGVAGQALRSGAGPGPSQCGPYRLVRLIGSGGMGSVYLAERSDGEIEQKVAVKLLHAGPHGPAWRNRFLKERQLLADLNHPAIAHVMDAGHARDGQPYLVMEYVDGAAIDVYAANIGLREKLQLFLRVCDGVSHAHRHLIIHRDLKPSNILVNASGQPKLLDFGIAKLLDETGDPTQTMDRFLTPNYASPEQLRGAPQTTATDVYSLGAVLYKLAAGRSPHESDSGTSQAIEVITGSREIPAPSRLNAALAGDIDSILRKALRREPNERYASVEAFADDIRAFLDLRPVQARSGDAWYRTRRYLRRYWLPVSAAAMTVAALSLGLYVANRERALAQRRFQQVRTLANKVLALDEVIRVLPGSTKARHEIVGMSKEYLEALGAEARTDRDLALEIGTAYTLLALAQGVPTTANLGQYAEAEESLRKADALLEPLLTASPVNRKALLTSATIAQYRMILAEAGQRKDETLPHAHRAVKRIEALLGLGSVSEAERTVAAQLFTNVALAHKNMRLYSEAVRYGRQAVEISQSLPSPGIAVSTALSIVADALRLSGELEGALSAIGQSRQTMEHTQFPSETLRRSSLFSTYWREGEILGADGGINAGRTDEAIASFQKAFNLVDEWTSRDPNDASGRILMASAVRELGAILRHSNPRRALEIYERGLLRLREVKNNVKVRRDEARLLAGSSYPLRSLHRQGEARLQIDSAFELLRQTKDHPATAISVGTAGEDVLLALADHHAETGQPGQAAEVYQELLDKIVRSKVDPRDDLFAASRISRIYDSLGGLCRLLGQSQRASAFESQRLALWRHWNAKIPGNSFIRRQLEAAAVHP